MVWWASRDALGQAGLRPQCVQMVESPDRSEVNIMLLLRGLIDVIIPRGGAGLIKDVVSNSTVPVIETGAGNCHVYVDGHADLSKAEAIAINAKCSNPAVCNAAVCNAAVCNAMETLLVHSDVARVFLPPAIKRLRESGVAIRGCSRTQSIVPGIEPAAEKDWEEEYLDLILAVRVVECPAV